MPECHFCYETPVFVVTFDNGREISVCANTICFGRLVEVTRDEEHNADLKIHSVEVYEA